ncbi:uncharacterized protein [Procambarus clarkii]|uniref:uncharacterized protein n=1 Tax=Procambarus clarkii TaxID=6728 RepID=UPI0037430572
MGKASGVNPEEKSRVGVPKAVCSCSQEFCCRHDLCVTKSFFDTKPQHKVSWRHPRCKHWHQLFLVLTGCSNLRSVQLARSFQSADCDTDNSLVACKVKFQPRKIHRAKEEGRRHINVNKTRDLHRVEEFTTALVNALPGPPFNSASERWSHLRGTIFNTAKSTFGKRQNKSVDWFEASAVRRPRPSSAT